MKIVTDYVYPPIPNRSFDWSAVFDGYEPGAPIGWGPTEAAAIADLESLLDDVDKVFCRRCEEIVPLGADEGCRDLECGARRP